MAIPLVDLKRVHARVAEDMKRAVVDVLESGQFILGPFVAGFEAEVAEYLGVAHAIGVSSGTDALKVVLQVLEMTRGSGKVLTTPFTFIATAEAVMSAKLQPVFVDIDESTCLMDLDQAAGLLDSTFVGLLPVHLFGQCVDMDALGQLSSAHKLWVVEDAAQSFGACSNGRQSGSIGDAGCFSFFPSKNLGAAGDGGLITTDDDELARWCRASRVHGVLKRKYYHEFPSGNYRLDALQAAVLSCKLKHVDDWNRERQAVAQTYCRLLAEAGLVSTGAMIPLGVEEGATHVYHQFVVLARERDMLAAHLRDQGIATAVYYPMPLHVQDAFKGLGYAPDDFPVANRVSRRSLALPMFPGLTIEEQEEVVGRIAEFFAGRS